MNLAFSTVEGACRRYLRRNLYIQAVVIFITGPCDLDHLFLFKISFPGFVLYWILAFGILWHRSGCPRRSESMIIKWGSLAVVAATIAIASVVQILKYY